jgi:hypothetical protein
MNKIYRLVWNRSLGLWVVVAEIARGFGKASGTIGQVARSQVGAVAGTGGDYRP